MALFQSHDKLVIVVSYEVSCAKNDDKLVNCIIAEIVFIIVQLINKLDF